MKAVGTDYRKAVKKPQNNSEDHQPEPGVQMISPYLEG
jgi:hypothetical protein